MNHLISSSDPTKHRKALKTIASNRPKPLWISTLPCEILAYIAIHTFGIRMIYPGSVKLIQAFLHPTLVEGRAKLHAEEHGKRYKLKTIDDNDVDTFFVDNRGTNGTSNGKTLVICSEGKAWHANVRHGIRNKTQAMLSMFSRECWILWNRYHDHAACSQILSIRMESSRIWRQHCESESAHQFSSHSCLSTLFFFSCFRVGHIHHKTKMRLMPSCNLLSTNWASCQRT